MFHYRVKDWPEVVGYEGLSSLEYSGGQKILSPLNLSGDVGYWLAGNLGRPPVHPASKALGRWLPGFAEYCADEAWKLVASQHGDETLFVDELDDLILVLEPEMGFESMFSDPDRFGFSDKFTRLRARTLPLFSGGANL